MNHKASHSYFDLSAIFAGASAAAAVATFAWAVLRDRVAERDARVKALQGDKEAIAYVAYQIACGAWDSTLTKSRFRKDVIGALCLAYAVEGTDRAKSLVVAALRRLNDQRRHEVAAVLAQLHQHMLRYANTFAADAKFRRRVRNVEMLLEKLGIEVIAIPERGVRMPYDVNTLKELLLHTDNLFHTRVNFLLAVEALMFTGAASVWNIVDVRTGVAWFGVALTFIFFLVKLEPEYKAPVVDGYVRLGGAYRTLLRVSRAAARAAAAVNCVVHVCPSNYRTCRLGSGGVRVERSSPARPNFGVKLMRPGFGPAAELPTVSPA